LEFRASDLSEMPEFLSTELAAWSGGTWQGTPPISVRGVSIDTRTLEPGALYVALKGEHHDGHAYVEEALGRGATAAVVNRAFAAARPALGPLLVVKDTRRALMDIAAGYRQTLDIEMAAVSGSVGKTTVKEMLAGTLSVVGPTARTRGNWNNDIGVPLSLLAVEKGNRFGVFEVGMSHPGELAPLCELLQPAIGVLTTIGPVHLEFFDSVQAIAREKAEVFKALPATGMAVVCRDERWFDLLKSSARCPVVTTSIKGDADYVGKALNDDEGRFVVYEKASGDRVKFDTPLPGDYVIYDALLAIAVARTRGADWDALVEAIRTYKPLALRWNVQTIDGMDFVLDAYNANPVSMRAALQAFAQMKARGRKWVVLAGMRELGAVDKEEHWSLGTDVARGEWAGLIAVGDHGELIAEGAARAGWTGDRVVRCPDSAAAARALKERIAVGDAVLIKASRGERLEDVLAEWKKLRNKEGANCAC
jgi:UDP-N-acetylmuramoyl-tripeptide--D-alanyl-D-alanine ligase